jgi:hypothetical protein
MFDHVGFDVRDFGRSLPLYREALALLGIRVLNQDEGWRMLGGLDGRLRISRFEARLHRACSFP